jgi:SAM-dependent methyltransferase
MDMRRQDPDKMPSAPEAASMPESPLASRSRLRYVLRRPSVCVGVFALGVCVGLGLRMAANHAARRTARGGLPLVGAVARRLARAPATADHPDASCQMAGETHRHYLPAAGYTWALPFYDLLVSLLGGDAARAVLLGQAALRPGQRALDLGCGTGTLLIYLKRRHPSVQAVGIDPDPQVLARARRKALAAGVTVQLNEGFGDALPYRESSFDHVFSSFMLHHLEPPEKDTTLHEVRRILAPGGVLHLLDFGGETPRAHSGLTGWLHGSARLRDNFGGGIGTLVRSAGFSNAQPVSQGALLFGFLPITYYRATVVAE